MRGEKLEVKRIENNARRQATFCKRRGTLLKKADELAVLCDDDVRLGLIIFSSTGKLFDYSSPYTSWSELIQRYESTTNTKVQGTNHDDDQQVLMEVARLKCEIDHLEASIRRQTGQELPISDLTEAELHNIQQQHASALYKVRERKDELLNQYDGLLNQQEERLNQQQDELLKLQLGEERNKVHILEEENSVLEQLHWAMRHLMNEGGQSQAAPEALTSTVIEEGMMPPTVPAEEAAAASLQQWTQLLDGRGSLGLEDHGLPELC